ncbi:hypothetical protein [Altererythrobacter sp. Z27]|uniref:hypothetical protein n=1 Tax=Altererythrobacter sp. Z27 TaxID=3461147 RepID=UPI0040447B22
MTTTEDKRSALRTRIQNAQERLAGHQVADQARDAAGTLVDYAKRNPLIVLGGAAALGLALGRLSRGGRAASTATSLLGRIATDAAIAFALTMYDKAVQRAKEEQEEGDLPHLSDETGTQGN